MPRRCPIPSENVPARLWATDASPVISMTWSTRRDLIPWVVAWATRCSRAVLPGCTPFASSRTPTSPSGALCSA
ncbi:hypothetical protein D3C74_435590 [compost metagenome]